jgi:hypothetical protein
MVLIRMLIILLNKILILFFFSSFWDERFLFECNDKSNQLRLQIFDHKKPNHKKINQPTFIDTIYADVSIPFAYVTSTIYKQDVRITPQYPDSIIRIEVRHFFAFKALEGSLLIKDKVS